MKAVILVGGEGTRLRPLSYDVPKPMMPIVNRPFMEHMVDNLVRHGFNEIVFALGYKSDAFGRHFQNDGNRWGARFWHEVESFPLGTAGPVKNVEALLDDTFLVFNGDVLADVDLTALLRLHRDLGAVGTLALTPVEDPSTYGVVVTDAEKRVRAFIEKPPRDQAPSNAINAGMYVLEPQVLKYMQPGVAWSFERQLFPDLVAAGEKLCATITEGYWLDIGSPSRYLQGNHDVLRGAVRAEVPELDGARRWIADSARIDPSAEVEGPVWIAQDCVVSAGVRLEGPLVLRSGVFIGERAQVTRSVLWEGSRVGVHAWLHECLVGRRAVVGDEASMESLAVLGSGERLPSGATLAAGEKQP